MAFDPHNRNLKHAMDLYFVALKAQYELICFMGEETADAHWKSLVVAEKTAQLDIKIHELNRFIRQQNLNDSFYHFLDAFRTLTTTRI